MRSALYALFAILAVLAAVGVVWFSYASRGSRIRAAIEAGESEETVRRQVAWIRMVRNYFVAALALLVIGVLLFYFES